MKKFIRKSIAAVLVIAAVLCFAGCNGAVGNDAIFIRSSINYELPDEPAGIIMDAGRLDYSDIAKVSDELKEEFPEEEISVVPVYSNDANVFSNDEVIFIYGVDPSHASHLGLEEMADGTAYFATEQSGKIDLEISVLTEETPDGCTFGDLAYMTLDAQTGVSEKGLLKVMQDECFTPGMLEFEVCFVTTNTYLEIASASLGAELKTLEEAEKFSGIINLLGMYVCAENSEEVRACLTELNYK